LPTFALVCKGRSQFALEHGNAVYLLSQLNPRQIPRRVSVSDNPLQPRCLRSRQSVQCRVTSDEISGDDLVVASRSRGEKSVAAWLDADDFNGVAPPRPPIHFPNFP